MNLEDKVKFKKAAMGTAILLAVLSLDVLISWGISYTNTGSINPVAVKLPAFAIILRFMSVIAIWLGILSRYSQWASDNELYNINTKFDRLTLVWVIISLFTALVDHYMAGRFLPFPQSANIAETVRHYMGIYGPGSGLMFISMQYMYYILKIVIEIFILDMLQTMGDALFHKTLIPYGSVGLAFLWFVSHYIVGGVIPGSLFSGIAIGIYYLLCGKNIWPVFAYLLIHNIV